MVHRPQRTEEGCRSRTQSKAKEMPTLLLEIILELVTNLSQHPLTTHTLLNTASLQITLIAHASERAETKRDRRRMVMIKGQVSSANENASEPTGKTASQIMARIDTRSLSTKAAGSETWICLKQRGKSCVKVDLGLRCWKASKAFLGAGRTWVSYMLLNIC